MTTPESSENRETVGSGTAESVVATALELLNDLTDAGLLPFCGEWIEGADERCTARAEFILWGKLIPPDGLGPRCYDHAAKHIGHRGLSRPGKSGWAVADLRPLIRLTGGYVNG